MGINPAMHVTLRADDIDISAMVLGGFNDCSFNRGDREVIGVTIDMIHDFTEVKVIILIIFMT